MKDTSHLVALHESLAREKSRFASARNLSEREFRHRQIRSKEREIEAEYRFLGMEPSGSLTHLTDDELLAELES